jgi:hypothetical protein
MFILCISLRRRNMDKVYVKRNCEYYDWGKTAPREYGAFCELKKCCIEKANCAECIQNITTNKE